jgi:hypothetical protein
VLCRDSEGITVMFSDGEEGYYYHEELPHERMYILEVS